MGIESWFKKKPTAEKSEAQLQQEKNQRVATAAAIGITAAAAGGIETTHELDKQLDNLHAPAPAVATMPEGVAHTQAGSLAEGPAPIAIPSPEHKEYSIPTPEHKEYDIDTPTR